MYRNVIFTVIAACLLWICARDVALMAAATEVEVVRISPDVLDGFADAFVGCEPFAVSLDTPTTIDLNEPISVELTEPLDVRVTNGTLSVEFPQPIKTTINGCSRSAFATSAPIPVTLRR